MRTWGPAPRGGRPDFPLVHRSLAETLDVARPRGGEGKGWRLLDLGGLPLQRVEVNTGWCGRLVSSSLPTAPHS